MTDGRVPCVGFVPPPVHHINLSPVGDGRWAYEVVTERDGEMHAHRVDTLSLDDFRPAEPLTSKG